MSNSAEGEILLPFLKWAGGKRWLAASYSKFLNVPYCRYVEPFLGGGAIFFHLAPQKALLSDINADLINCYAAIKENPQAVRRALLRHQRLHSHDYYYEERSRPIAWENTGTGNILNRTNGFNGLMRFLRPAYRNFTTDDKPVSSAEFLSLFEAVSFNDAHFNTDRYKPGTSGETALYNDLVRETGIT